jgi:hypothetical protein
MTDTMNGFYAAYLSGTVGQGFAMFVLRDGKIAGAGALGDIFDGSFRASNGVLDVHVTTKSPPNIPLIQGGTTGPMGESGELKFQLPETFSSQEFIRLETHRGPVNVKLVKLRALDD